MAIVDQRILIPAPQPVVWAFLSDLSNNRLWQEDCEQIAFLSSMRSGVKTRWRVSDRRGHDAIFEIASWYNGLGYEYIYVDGSPYRDARGRLRLQEIPEGTVVQWTLTFETKGLFRGGVRTVETSMANGLKALYRQIKSLPKPDTLSSASLMQDAPDVDGRTNYQPRHTPTVDEKRIATPGGPMTPADPADDLAEMAVVSAAAAVVIEEPPFTVEDTRPNVTVPAQPLAEPSPVDEPVALSPDAAPTQAVNADVLSYTSPAPAAEDSAALTVPALPPVPEPETVRPSLVETMPLDAPVIIEPEIVQAAAPEESTPADVEPVLTEPSSAPSAASSEPAPAANVEPLPAATVFDSPVVPAIAAAAVLSSDPVSTEAEHKSIWEVFGVERPAVLVEAPAAASLTAETSDAADMAQVSSRIGLRARSRRQAAHVRFPN